LNSQWSAIEFERVVNRIESKWIPVNHQFGHELIQDLATGTFDETPEKLVETLRLDIALYLFVIKELAIRGRSLGIGVSSLKNPEEILSCVPSRSIASIVSRAVETIPDLKASSLLADRILETLEVSVTAYSGGKQTESASTLFGISIARQMGNLLIAFSFPDEYCAMMSDLKSFDGFELACREVLGFTPLRLTSKLLMRWGFLATLPLLGEPTPRTDPAESKGSVDESVTGLREICAASELLAKTRRELLYPGATDAWSSFQESWPSAAQLLPENPSPDDLKLLLREYQRVIPSLCSAGVSSDPMLLRSAREQDPVLRQNPFISRCKGACRDDLTDLYQRMPLGGPAPELLSPLIKNTISVAGFSAVVIFTLNPDSRELVPVMWVGNPQTISITPAPLHDKSLIVTRAYLAKRPLIWRTRLPGPPQREVASISWILGFSRRIGVTHLEMPGEEFSSSDIEYLYHFKAICQALNDMLGLN
jgi:hypothetical protein